MKIGYITDGLVVIYKIYKKSNTATIKTNLGSLKQILKEIYLVLPPELRNDFRKKRLKSKEHAIDYMDIQIQNSLLRHAKKALKVAAEIYQTLVSIKGYHNTIFVLGYVFGDNTEFAKYLFRELSKEQEESIPILEVKPPKQNRLLIPLQYTSLIIGRMGTTEKNALIIRDKLVSRPHCRITRDHNNITIEDLSSRNGTYINDDMMKNKVALTSGDKITIGQTKINFQIMKQEEIIGTLETRIMQIDIPIGSASITFQSIMILVLMIIILTVLGLFILLKIC